jgi:hypothetical protein
MADGAYWGIRFRREFSAIGALIMFVLGGKRYRFLVYI